MIHLFSLVCTHLHDRLLRHCYDPAFLAFVAIMSSIIKVGDKWRAQVRRKGFPKRTATFKTKGMAAAWAKRVEEEIDAARAGVQLPGQFTVADLIDDYCREASKLKPFGVNKRSVLRMLREILGQESIEGLTTARVVRYITEERRVRGVTASIDLTYLSSVLKWARTMNRINVPLEEVARARDVLSASGVIYRSSENDRLPTDEEVERIRGYLRTHSRSLTPDVIDFILATGMRPPSEIVRLRWEDLDEAGRTILVRDRKDPRRKIGNHMRVPLLGEAFDIVMRQPRVGDLIFPFNGKSWSSIFPRACAALGIHGVNLYSLRHLGLTRMFRKGYSIEQVALVSGHRSWQMLQRYTHIQAADLHNWPVAATRS